MSTGLNAGARSSHLEVTIRETHVKYSRYPYFNESLYTGMNGVVFAEDSLRIYKKIQHRMRYYMCPYLGLVFAVMASTQRTICSELLAHHPTTTGTTVHA